MTTLATKPPRTIAGKLWRSIVGKPLATKDLPHQAISRFVGLAVFASDALSSTAYATEEILVILAFAGTAIGANSFGVSIPIAICIAVLLAIVTISYRQTIMAYPNGGGAYIVARDNFGETAAQVGGAALLTDYILTVAVSISAGVAQIVSAVPTLSPYRVQIAVAVIVLMTLMNLRGVKESGRVFAVPTYFFVSMAFLMLIVGGISAASGNLGMMQPCAEGLRTPGCVEVVHYALIEPLTLFLILRAFSSGCTALTGIEAISNGITAFKDPKSKNAAATLVAMSTILITLFIGFTLLANAVHAFPSHQETVISQMARGVYGQGHVLYFATLLGTTLILLMAANTSYADFPRLAALIAGDGFLPRHLTIRGSRLVYSVGIATLGLFSILLVVFLNAQTSALIPLYAIGVFLSFTLSQSGMVVRYRKIARMMKRGILTPEQPVKTRSSVLAYDPHWRIQIVVSGLGAVCTFFVMLIFAVTKFSSGAWLVVFLIPTLVAVFFRIHNHYKEVAKQLSAQGRQLDRSHHVVSTVLLIDDVHIGTLRLVEYARSLGTPWTALHIALSEDRVDIVKKKWADRIGGEDLDKLVVIESPFRHLVEPIREYVTAERNKHPDGYVNVIMGHLVMDSAWEQVLHQNSAYIFSLGLQNIDHVVVTTVPYQLRIENGNGHGKGNGNGHGKDAPNAAPSNASQETP
ncbi:MAG TPA: APC family permease [Aggregatilineales bacterium]|nr:APC family permease [Anaerolineales bacterium]HRE46372.1 APC family permease [Aggregatilineales bacterium]